MNRLIKYGDKGELVKVLQAHLNSLIDSKEELLVEDGIFGKKTLRTVLKYLNTNSTVVDIDSLECNLKVIRTEFNTNNTIGKLYFNNMLFCDTLEDTFREKKIANETCIPFGEYKVIINYSPRFKRLMPRLLDVPNFEGILIHSGNTEKDSSGCLIVGLKSGNKLINSRDTFNRLFNRLKNYSRIKIEIIK